MSRKDIIVQIIKQCCIEISKLIRQGDSLSLASDMHAVNKAGDGVKKLDMIANEILKEHLLQCPSVRCIGSEEEDKIVYSEYQDAPYLVCFDPLDGSSNIDVNITVGTIFALYKFDENGCILDGHNIELAGYCLYGGSTQFILADTTHVKMYTCHEEHDFILMEPNLRIPKIGPIYSINESNRYIWTNPKFQKAVDSFIKQGKTTRWVGSLVADAHRTLLKGGFFSYPGNENNPNGKLRLLYEVYPFAFIFQIAGGCSSNGTDDNGNILDIPFPTDNVHLKIPTILCSQTEFDTFYTPPSSQQRIVKDFFGPCKKPYLQTKQKINFDSDF